MTKEERLAYLKSKHVEPPEPIGELAVSIVEIEEELSLTAGYQEYIRENRNYLTSDEK